MSAVRALCPIAICPVVALVVVPSRAEYPIAIFPTLSAFPAIKAFAPIAIL